MTITVSTGGQSAIVEAKSPYEAVKKFLLGPSCPPKIGLISSCVSDELDDIYYVSNERVLRDLNLWKGGNQHVRRHRR